MIKPTHIAINKETKEKVHVEYNPKTNEYKETWAVCLKNPSTDWILEEINIILD